MPTITLVCLMINQFDSMKYTSQETPVKKLMVQLNRCSKTVVQDSPGEEVTLMQLSAQHSIVRPVRSRSVANNI